MNNIKDDRFYISKSLEHIEVIQNYTKGKKVCKFLEDLALKENLKQMLDNL